MNLTKKTVQKKCILAVNVTIWSLKILSKGAFINYVNKPLGTPSPKCQRHYIILCCKLVNEGGGGWSKTLKFM